MRNARLTAFALLTILICARPAAAQTKCVENWPKDGLNVAGQLGRDQIRAFLDLGYPAPEKDGVSGVVIYPERWKPGQVDRTAEIGVDGTVTADCQLRLTDSIGGTWQLTLAGQRVTGTRQLPAGASSKIALQIVPAMDCTGAGPWRTFTSTRWPITFEYPASWRLAENGGDIVVDCPDPASLAWGGTPIIFEQGQGRGEFVGAGGRRGTRIDRFVSFGGDRWLIGGDDCEDGDLGVFCAIARQSAWRGMTVLQGSAGEHRRYRVGGGYVGQGGGIMSYALLIGERWVRIDSHDTPASIDDLGSAGPVLFDGDGVTERLVRSLRRR